MGQPLPLDEDGIVLAWQANAVPWTVAVRAGQIESRRQVTDSAIIEAVCARASARVLDIGCGEGWLARALSARGIRVMGVDVVHALVVAASALGGGDFRVLPYAALTSALAGECFDALVCNFSLLGEASVEEVFRAAPALLAPGGRLLVQTLHPLQACGELPYRDGWRPGSWAGISGEFAAPAPWYFRTLESWVALFARHGLSLVAMREPVHPSTGRPASVMFEASARG